MSRASNTDIKECYCDACRLTELIAVSPLPSQLLRSEPARREWRCPCPRLREQLGLKLAPAKGSVGSADRHRARLAETRFSTEAGSNSRSIITWRCFPVSVRNDRAWNRHQSLYRLAAAPRAPGHEPELQNRHAGGAVINDQPSEQATRHWLRRGAGHPR
jgi:hypothetical protein